MYIQGHVLKQIWHIRGMLLSVKLNKLWWYSNIFYHNTIRRKTFLNWPGFWIHCMSDIHSLFRMIFCSLFHFLSEAWIFLSVKLLAHFFKSPQRGIISLITHDLSQDYYLLNACPPILSNSIKLKSPYPHSDQTGRGYYRVLSTEKWNGPFWFCRERWKPMC